MRDKCTHTCHRGGYECDPCWRLHTLVERMTEQFALSISAANDAAARHPSIRSTMRAIAHETEGLRQTFALMVSMGDVYSATMEAVESVMPWESNV